MDPRSHHLRDDPEERGAVRTPGARGSRAALEDRERRYRGLFATSGIGMAITDLDGRFVDANDAFLGLVGLSLDELAGREILTLTHPDDRGANARLLDELLAGRRSSFVLHKRYLVDDDEVWARVAVSVIPDAQGDPEHLVATIEDIGDRRTSEQRLRRSQALRRVAGQLARVGGWSIEADTGEVEWSDELFPILGVDGRAPPSLGDGLSLYLPGSREIVEAALDECRTVGTPFDLEVEIESVDGRRIAARIVGEAERDASGRVQRVLGAFQDVTEVRRAHRRASELARRLTATFETMTDALYAVDRDWRFTLLNRRAEELLLRSRDDLLGRVVWEEFPEARDTVIFEAFHESMRSGTSCVLEEVHYPPLSTWFEVHVHPTGEGLAVYFRDVSERREALTELAVREAQLARQAALLDAASDAINVRGLDNVIRYWNDSSQRLYGYDADEAVGADVRELLHGGADAPEHDTAVLEAAEQQVRRVGEWSGELTHRTRTGARLVVESRWTLVHDDDGRPDAVLEVNTDVTERRVLEQQHLRAQRMESLGTLAGGIAHDLNNMLSPILLASELLQADEDDERRREILRTVHSSARRGADLVTQVLSFARGIDGRRQSIAVGDLVADLERIVVETFPKKIALRTDVPDDLPRVTGDVTQLGQVLLNLALNARDAMVQGGVLRVSAASADLDQHYVGLNPLALVGAHVVIEVEDDGTGMPAEVTERIFEPFFTTKPHGSGTGLGLSTASAIVRSHDGFIQVYSEPGYGTTFRVYLPVEHATTPAIPIAEVSGAELPRGDGAGVLVVDDESAVREVTRQTLEAYGYRVLEASDGAQAVAVFARNRDRIDVVLTDMMMPIMDGPATVHALRRLDPGVRIIGASGLHGDGKVASAASAGVKHFLPKPYTAARMLGILHEVLHEAPHDGQVDGPADGPAGGPVG